MSERLEAHLNNSGRNSDLGQRSAIQKRIRADKFGVLMYLNAQNIRSHRRMQIEISILSITQIACVSVHLEFQLIAA